MKGYNSVKQELLSNTILNRQGRALLNFFLLSPKTEYEEKEFSFDFSLLKERGELREISSGRLRLEGGDVFFFLWFEELKQKFPIELSPDFNGVGIFLESIGNFYREQRIRNGLYSLINRLEQWLIVTLNQDFEYDFCDYAFSLKKESKSRDIYEFADRFGHTLPHLKISIGKLCRILLHLSNELKDERSLNYPDGSLRVGLKDLVNSNSEYGNELLTYLKTLNGATEYEALVLSGLVEIGGVYFLQEIKTKYLKDKQPILANALCILRNITDELALAVLDVIDALDLNNNDVAMYVPSIYRSVIEQRLIVNDYLKVRAFNALTSMWDVSKEIKPNVLHQVESIHGFEEERRSFIVNAFRDSDINVSRIGNMYGLHEINTPGFLFSLIEVVAERIELQFNAKTFDHLIDDLERKDDGKFSSSLIRLLIHDNGFVRFAGSRIYTHLTFGRSKFIFKYDILSLQEVEQIKLIVAVLTEMNPPQDTLVNILKLLDSPYKNVVDYLIGKLKAMVESFFDSVSQEMEAGIKHDVFKNANAVEIVKEYHMQFVKYIDEKEAIKEFNPWLNEYTLSKYYTELNQRKNSRLVSESMNKNSGFLQFATKINLVKGGGWKLEGKDEIQQLGNFSSSTAFPRTYFIASEYLDRIITNRYLVKWEQIFQWERIQL